MIFIKKTTECQAWFFMGSATDEMFDSGSSYYDIQSWWLWVERL